MKIRRQKKAQRILTFYRNNFGFRAPFHVVLDGTFCQKALTNQINLKEQIPKYFSNEVKLLTTACILTELERLGPAVRGALLIVKQFPLRKCGHEKNPISASKCLLSLVRGQNPEHYITATQDFDVMAKLAARPCCPILSLKGNAVTLSKPSLMSRELAETAVAEMQTGSTDQDVAEVRELAARELGLRQKDGIKRKKRKGGPNPLSCKKKKVKESNKSMDASSSSPSKKRHRNRANRSSGPCLQKHFRRIVDSVNKST